MRRSICALARGLGAAMVLAGGAKAASPSEVLATYADIAQAGYEDSLKTARALDSAIDRLLAAPDDASLLAARAARAAWVAAHAGFRRLGELDAGGIGVHEALLLKGGRLAALAIGGIATHPDYPREKLNLPTMEPGIAYLDLATGGIVEKRLLPRALHQLSLRHLAEDASGCLWLGGQYEGAALNAPPLVARHRPGGELEMLEAPEESYRALRNYVGSVAANASGARVAVSSPRGGRVLVWEAASGRLLEERAIDDVCGLAAAGPAFLESDGKGRLWRGAALLRRDEAVAWDNHLTAVSAG